MYTQVKQKRLGKLLGMLLALTATQPASAVEWVANFGLDFGGDTMATAFFTNGDTQNIKAGELFSGAIGLIFENTDSLETQLTIGIKADFITADNGSIDWIRYPVELLEFYKLEQWRLGGGLTYHLSPELSGDGVASNVDASFDDALGFIVEADYFFSDNAYFGARYTSIDYEIGSYSIDGSSIGMLIGARF